MSVTKGMIANAIWEVIVSGYGQGGKTKVALPMNEVVDILTTVFANVVSQIPEAHERDRVMRNLVPKVERIVTSVRNRPYVELPSKPKLVLPN